MTKVLRTLGALALATATVPILAVAPASAATTLTIPAGAQGYFNASAVDKPDPAPAAPPNVATQVDGVEPGKLAVAAKGGTEDKVSAILFDVSTLEPGSIVTKAVLTLPLATDGENVNLSAAPEKVRACAAGDTGFGGEDGSAIALAPARLCNVFAAPAKASADLKSYVFDITGLASTWVDGANDGLTLTAADGAVSTNFQVVFQSAITAGKLAVEYTPATDTTVAPPTVSTGTASTPDFGAGPGVAPQPATGGFGSVTPPVMPVAPAPAPAPAPGVAPAPAAAPVAATGPVALSTSVRPNGQFWLGALLLGAVLLLLSLIMGDTTVAAATKRPSRLSRALAERQRGVGTARPALGRPVAI